MTDRGNMSKPGMNQKPQQTDAAKRGMKGTVGKNIPDESKERHTEIAVEVGRKMGDSHDEKH